MPPCLCVPVFVCVCMYMCMHCVCLCICVCMHPGPAHAGVKQKFRRGSLRALLMSSDRWERKRRMYLVINKAPHRALGLRIQRSLPESTVNPKLSAQTRKELSGTVSLKRPRSLRFHYCSPSGTWETAFLAMSWGLLLNAHFL